MFRPVDLQVLIARTLEVQRQQGAMTKMAEGEGEQFRKRLQTQVEDEQRQVQRKKNDLALRIGKRSEHNGQPNQEQKQTKREEKEPENNPLGHNIDLEM